MLESSAVSVADGFTDKGQEVNKQQDHRKRSPIIQTADSQPPRASNKRPIRTELHKEEGSNYSHASQDYAFRYVAKYVVTHLVAYNKQRLIRTHFCYCRIPDNHSLGTSKASHVRVDFVYFFAGFHLEQPLGRNVQSCVLNNLLYLIG